jgi:hypothetical protein
MTTRFPFPRALAAVATALLVAGSFRPAEAHITYGNRSFGTWSDSGGGWSVTGNSGTLAGGTVTITGQTVSSLFGWADAADANWGDSHRMRAFRVNLQQPGRVTITASRTAGDLLPAFSIYSGLSHTQAEFAHDSAPKSVEWLTDTFGTGGVAEAYADSNTNGEWDPGESFTDTNANGVWDSAGLGNSGKKGSFNALGSWTIGNSDKLDAQFNVIEPATLKSFTLVGHAADGTAANYSSFATGAVNGDGLADGTVSGMFDLAAGDYTIMVGGASYAAQLTEGKTVGGLYGATYPSHGITTTLTVAPVPEPAGVVLVAAGLAAAAFAAARRRAR